MNFARTRAEARRTGAKLYISHPCSYGHFAPRRTASGNCTECVKTVHKLSKVERLQLLMDRLRQQEAAS